MELGEGREKADGFRPKPGFDEIAQDNGAKEGAGDGGQDRNEAAVPGEHLPPRRGRWVMRVDAARGQRQEKGRAGAERGRCVAVRCGAVRCGAVGSGAGWCDAVAARLFE